MSCPICIVSTFCHYVMRQENTSIRLVSRATPIDWKCLLVRDVQEAEVDTLDLPVYCFHCTWQTSIIAQSQHNTIVRPVSSSISSASKRTPQSIATTEQTAFSSSAASKSQSAHVTCRLVGHECTGQYGVDAFHATLQVAAPQRDRRQHIGIICLESYALTTHGKVSVVQLSLYVFPSGQSFKLTRVKGDLKGY